MGCSCISLYCWLFMQYLLLGTSTSDNKRVQIACVGDSITYGSGATDRNRTSYPPVLQVFRRVEPWINSLCQPELYILLFLYFSRNCWARKVIRYTILGSEVLLSSNLAIIRIGIRKNLTTLLL